MTAAKKHGKAYGVRYLCAISILFPVISVAKLRNSEIWDSSFIIIQNRNTKLDFVRPLAVIDKAIIEEQNKKGEFYKYIYWFVM